jgi:hypothetical protein
MPTHQDRRRSAPAADAKALQPPPWITRELEGCQFADERLKARVALLLSQLSAHPGESVPMATQDWANAKAAYRLLDNDRVDEAEILAGHFAATRARAQASSAGSERLFVMHDTTEFSFKRQNIEAVGKTRLAVAGAHRDGTPRHYTACGLLMHGSLVVSEEGLPLGLAAVKFWSREKFHGANRLKRHINPTRVPIEQKESFRWLENVRHATAVLGDPQRCVHVADRESDIFELFCLCRELRTHFIFRTCNDRLAGDGGHTVGEEMAEVKVGGRHRVEVTREDGSREIARLELRYRRLRICPPIGKQSCYPALELTVLHATETDVPDGRDPIEWKLVTDLPVTRRAEAIDLLGKYAMRWKIETYHKILKSGCRAEQSKLRSAERLVNLLALNLLLAWRIFWLTMLNRATRGASARLAFTLGEVALLKALASKAHQPFDGTAADAIHMLARLGGYLDRARDGPPGNQVIWRGLGRLSDLLDGYNLAQRCG